jgi:hypothetical protein
VSDDYRPDLVHVVLERCSVCGELAPTATSLGETPAVNVRWQFRKSETCDHVLIDFLAVTNRSDIGP